MWGKQLSQNEAMDVARNFFGHSGDLRSTEEIKLAAVAEELTDVNNLRSAADESAFYVFNRGNSGFVIVAGDDRMKQVLGYSKNSAFVTENIPANLKAMLNAYSALHADLDKVAATDVESASKSSNQFADEVQPLLGDINWGQSEPYNLDCPEMEDGRSVTGCAATALAMVMKYYEYPVKGHGTYSYKTSSGITCSYDYENNTFDWENMLPQYVEGQYTEKQGKAVANLMYACGVALNMEYSPIESGTSMALNYERALIDIFGYNKNLGYALRYYYTSNEWMNLVKEELNAKRIVYYGGTSLNGGHAFLIDGYDKDNLVHVNWGWDGYFNGYFEIASLDSNSPGVGSESVNGYFMYQQMVIGLQPDSENYNYTSRFVINDMSADKLEFKKGEKIHITSNVTNMTSAFNKGEIAVIAENNNGEQTIIASKNISTPLSIKDGEIDFPFEVVIPQELKDGNYRLYIATKEEREDSFSKTKSSNGIVSEYTLAVNGESCVMIPFSGNLDIENDLNVGFELPDVLYTGSTVKLKMSFENKNPESEYFDTACLMLLDKESKEPMMILGKTFQIFIPADSLKNIELSIPVIGIDNNGNSVNIPSGVYEIAPFAFLGNDLYSVGESKQITIGQGCYKLKVSNGYVKPELGLGEKLKYSADIMLDGEGDGFTGELAAVVYNKTNKTFVDSVSTYISFDKNMQPYKLNMEFDTDFNPGDYFIALFYINTPNFTLLTIPLDFSVSTNPTSIEVQPAGVEGLTVCGISNGNNIRIKTSELANGVEIYTINGQKVLQETLTPGVGNIYNLNAANISEGVYIMVVRTSDGKVYRAKFRI